MTRREWIAAVIVAAVVVALLALGCVGIVASVTVPGPDDPPPVLPMAAQIGALPWSCLHRLVGWCGQPELGAAVELIGQRVDAEA